MAFKKKKPLNPLNPILLAGPEYHEQQRKKAAKEAVNKKAEVKKKA